MIRVTLRCLRVTSSLSVHQYVAGVSSVSDYWEWLGVALRCSRLTQSLPVRQCTAGVCSVKGRPKLSVHSESSSGVSSWHMLPGGRGSGQGVHTAPQSSPGIFERWQEWNLSMHTYTHTHTHIHTHILFLSYLQIVIQLQEQQIIIWLTFN